MRPRRLNSEMNNRLRILIVEDSEHDSQLLIREIRRGGYEVDSERVDTATTMRVALERQAWDLVISDHSMPRFSSLHALELLKASGHDLPFIIISGSISEDAAVTTLKAGAHDFMTKDNLARLLPAIQRELKDAETRRERRRAEEAVFESEKRFRNLFENTPVAIWEEDFSAVKAYLDGLKSEGTAHLEVYLSDHPEAVSKCIGLVKILDVNQAGLEMHKAKTKSELINSLKSTFTPQTLDAFKQELLAIARGEHSLNMDEVVQTLDGEPVDASLRWAVVPEHEKDYSRVLVSLADITERKQRERELEAIATVSAALRSPKTLDKLLPRLIDETLALLHAEMGSIWLLDSATNEIHLRIQRGWDEVIPPIRSGQSIPGYVIEHNEVVVSREFHTDVRASEENRDRIPKGIGGACVPLRAAESVVGVMFINVRLPREITTGELRVLNALAEIGGSAIHRMSLHEQTVKQLERLGALRAIDIAISGSIDLRLSLNIVLEQVSSQLGIDAVSVLLMKPGSGRLEYAAGRGFRTPNIESTSLRLDQGYVGQAALEKRIIHIEDLTRTKDTLIRRDMLASEEFISYFGVPLIAKGEVKGVMEIFHRSNLQVDLEWMNFLESLGWQTAIAVDNALLFEGMQRSNFDMELAYEATIEGWSKALDLRDKETEGHTQRVTEMTMKLARTMGIKEAQLVQMRRGALLHDIGKMGVPDHILLKPGPLTDEEWKIMRMHPQFAHDLLAPITYLQQALEIPAFHHERWDGSGYPNGLKGILIPLSARIFAVIDVFDALTSDRPYRSAWSQTKARDYIRENSGTRFDPQVVDMFLNNFADIVKY